MEDPGPAGGESGLGLCFVTDRKPTHVGIDPYNYYLDRNSTDNVLLVK